MELGDGLKKLLLAGVGTVAVTAEKSREILDELVKKGTHCRAGQGSESGTEAQHQRNDQDQDFFCRFFIL